jgi:hypothetical protein
MLSALLARGEGFPNSRLVRPHKILRLANSAHCTHYPLTGRRLLGFRSTRLTLGNMHLDLWPLLLKPRVYQSFDEKHYHRADRSRAVLSFQPLPPWPQEYLATCYQGHSGQVFQS